MSEQDDKAAKEKETREKIEKMAASALSTAKETTKVAMPYIKKGLECVMSLIKSAIQFGKQKLEERKKAAEAAKAAQPAAPATPPAATAAPVAPAAPAEVKKDETPKSE